MEELRLKARAKINISLDILGRRSNGYHDVKMIMQTIDLYDKILLRKIDESKIELKSNLYYLPVDSRNLVYKIAEYMKTTYNIKQGIYIELFKMIPVAAGLAGGSTDAATTILGINEMFNLSLSKEEMMNIGAKFGADIPYCILGGCALAEGLGEKLTLLNPFPMTNVLVVKPKFSVSTKSVYENLVLEDIKKHPNTEELIEAIKIKDKEYIYNNLINVLELVTFKMHPEVKKIKEELIKNGADTALMSGSGPSIYAFFENKELAIQICEKLRNDSRIKFAYLTNIYNRKKERKNGR